MGVVVTDGVALTPPMIRIFGGVSAAGAEGEIELGGPKPRAVLAALVIDPGAVVSTDRLAEVLWGDHPPARTDASIRGYVSNLRKALGSAGADPDTVIVFRERGYVLDVAPDQVDLHRFEQAVNDGGAHLRLGDMIAARRTLTGALGSWRGAPFGALDDHGAFVDVVVRLQQRRAEAVETLGEARLALGEHDAWSAELIDEIALEPYRERLRTQLATALYRSGRHVEALRSLDDARRVLADDVGVDPGPEMRALEAAILAHDAALAPPHTLAPAVASEMAGAGDAQEAAARPVRRPARERPSGPALFGRDNELAALDAALKRLPDGGCGVIVSGEAGIGKTAVLRRLRDTASTLGVPAGWGRCPEAATAAPYRSWSTAIGQAIDAGAPGDLQRAVPEALEGAASDDRTAARLATHFVVADALASLTAPVVVVIDDLQWADDATLALLEFVASELEEFPLLLAVTVRRTPGHELPGPLGDTLAALARSPNTLQLPLSGLDADSVAEWVGTTFGDSFSHQLAVLLTVTTDGNPFYLGELLSLMESEHSFEPGAPPRLPTSVPAAVQDVVRRRISRLPPETQALLAVAAVIGRRFDIDVLAEVADLEVPAVGHALVAALDAALLEADGLVPGRMVFVHALVSEALMAEQNPINAALLHARITVAIERRRAGHLDGWLEELAFHACAGASAGTARQAVEYSIAAADVAQVAQATGDVAAHLQRALAVMAVGGERSVEERIVLLTRCGAALRESGELIDGRAMLIDACLLAESIDDDQAIATALAALNSDDLWAGLDWSTFDQRVVAMIERVLGRANGASAHVTALLSAALAAELLYLDPPRSDRVSAAAVEAAEEAGEPLVLARVLLQRYWAVSGSSGTAERSRIGDRLILLAESGALPDRFSPLAHLARVSSAYELGQIDIVEQQRIRARASAHPVGTPTAWAHLLYLEASLALLRGDLNGAARDADALGDALWLVRRFAAPSTRAALLAMVECERGAVDEALRHLAVVESTPYGASIGWLKAWMLAEAGRESEAAAALASFDAPLSDDWYRTPLTASAVMAAARLGDRAFLERHLHELTPLANRFACAGAGGIVLGPVGYALALAEHRLGHTDTARAHAEQALAMSTRIGAVLWTARIEQLRAVL